jgi:glycogen debranching enzyme
MPEEIIQVENQYYILATSSRTADRSRVIKCGDTFAVFDSAGSIRPVGMGDQGIYHDGTRFLSWFELALGHRRLQPLRSTVRQDNVLLVELTNPDYLDLPDPIARASLHVSMSSFLFAGSWYGRITVHNFSLRPVEIDASVRFGADYVDIFEVRGMKRERRGVMRVPQREAAAVVLGYDGLDRVTRSTRIVFSPSPRELTVGDATWTLQIPPHGEQVLEVTATFAGDPTSYERALERAAQATREASIGASLAASNPRVHEWIERSAGDLTMMITETKDGPYPYAGVPWFSTVFGRDGLITAFETLWLDPSIARGVLSHLAATQAVRHDPANDAEPGKIVHETRKGEMAALGEIPFGRYYGSVDATPLFIALAGSYYRRTADRAFIEELWPHIERALAWIETDGDPDGDGFVEYSRRSSTGLVSQGWKDSADSISHRDGVLAEGPIALCEVQGYVYGAQLAAAILARALGRDDRAEQLKRRAESLRSRFHQAFWSDELGTYCLALDGSKRPCKVRASNAGHALLSGITLPEYAGRVCESLMDPHMFSGWGIRTLDDREARYNPMSYHNGSVWPHDNAIAALGMARWGYKEHALTVLSAMYRASVQFDLHRMPELFCGFPRVPHDGPTPYPVACSPQAWAAGAVFMLLQACFGLDIDAPHRQLRLVRPLLPDNMEQIEIRNLRVGEGSADLTLHRHGQHVAVQVDSCEGDLQVVVVKR